MTAACGLPYYVEVRVRGKKVKFVYWQTGEAWLGFLQDYPDYWTQGKTLADLKDHLKDLYGDVTSGEIPGIRKVEDLVIS